MSEMTALAIVLSWQAGSLVARQAGLWPNFLFLFWQDADPADPVDR